MKDVRYYRDMESMHNMTWAELAGLEPELNDLLAVARLVGNSCRTWRDVERGWSQFKSDVARLVGLLGENRQHPVLGTVAAYDVVYWRLHNAVARDRRAAD
jgi:hypothetical protein